MRPDRPEPRSKQAIIELLEKDLSVTMGLSVVDILYNDWNQKEIQILSQRVDEFTTLQSDFFMSSNQKYQKTIMFFHGFLLLSAINFKNKTL